MTLPTAEHVPAQESYDDETPGPHEHPPRFAWRAGTVPWPAITLLVLVVAAAVLQRFATGVLDSPGIRTWATMFVSVVVQALPFLVGGVLLAAVISTLVSERLIARIAPVNPIISVPAAGLAGVALPGCECASVPVASGLMRRGIGAPTALTFVLAAPAVNPIVLVTTAVAFAGQTDMVLARFAASMAVAILVGWMWVLLGRQVPVRVPTAHVHATKWRSLVANVQHDLLHTGGFLVLGGAIAAAINAFLPMSVLDSVSGSFWLSVALMALFAFLVAICSEADAFVAASMSAFSPVAQLTFMVVGPAMDVKLASLHAGQFGARFARVFVPLTVLTAVAVSLLVGGLFL